MKKISKLRWGISIISLFIIGFVFSSGTFWENTLKIGICYALALGVIDIIYKLIERNKRKNQ